MNLIKKIQREYRKKFWTCCTLGTCIYQKPCEYKGNQSNKSNENTARWYCLLYKK